jgi:hypothetical protein
MKRKKNNPKKWIQAATKGSRKGALHRALGVPLDRTIPLAKLKKAAKKSGKIGRMARFAETMRNLRK